MAHDMSAPRAVPSPSMSEAVWQRQFIELAETCGYTVNHNYRSKVAKGAWRTTTTVKGWPDLCCYKPGDFLFVELKADNGSLSVEQNTVLADLSAAGVDVYVYAPLMPPRVSTLNPHTLSLLTP